MHHYYNHVNFSSFFKLLFSSKFSWNLHKILAASWHFLPTMIIQIMIFQIQRSKSQVQKCWEVAWDLMEKCCATSNVYIPRTRLLTTSWIWYRWQWTQRLFCSFFSLQQLFCFWFDRHYFHHLVVQKMLLHHHRHLPNVL